MTQHAMASKPIPGTGGWLDQLDASGARGSKCAATQGCSSPDCDYCRQVRLMMRAPQKPQGLVRAALSLIVKKGTEQ